MRRRSYTLTLAIVSTLALGACLFPSLDGLVGGDASVVDVSASSEASPPDAITIADADAGSETDADLDADADVMRTYAQEISADLPASWWRFGETDAHAPAYDEMGAAPGVYQIPGVTVGVTRAIANDKNSAAKFDGNNGAMYVSGSLYDFGGTSSFCIEVWVSPAHAVDASDAIQRIVSHRTTTPYVGWRLYLDGSLRAYFDRWNNDVAVATVSTSKALTTNKFTHLVVTSDGTTLTLYENGVVESQAPAGSTGNASTTSLAWATGSLLNGEFFVGALDEATIYAHPLTPARVLAHYNAGLGK